MKSLVVIAALLLSGQIFGQGALGEVMGEVRDQNGAVIYDATVFIDDNGSLYRTKTDYEGRFRISGIPAGRYILNVRQYEDTMTNILVNVPMDGFDNIGVIEFSSSIVAWGPVDAGAGLNDVKLVSGNLPVLSIDSKSLMRSPLKNNLSDLITTMSSEVRMSPDGDLMFRGARKGDMLYLMDGVKTSSIGAVPSSSIGRVMVYTGGIPAKYGDTMGGVIVMESKSYFDLYREWEADEIRAGRR
ncbi:MAG: carboxypeptidase regulatory-like domain-containing protein [Crocinitomicaceae bacterium]|nr:carboxypeptidase regulatory-like domain-containing protein [Crocinitomicaceae bacterium]